MPGAKQSNGNELAELVRTLLIAQLGLAGVSQKNIRAIAKCDMNRVSAILKLLNTKRTAQS